MNDGASRADIIKMIDSCGESKEEEKAASAEVLQIAQEALEGNNGELSADADVLRRFNHLSGLIQPALRFAVRALPGVLKTAPLSLIALRVITVARLGQVTVRVAANDRALTVIRRAIELQKAA